MLENIDVVVNGKKAVVKKGITLLELSKLYEHEYMHKIIVAKVNMEYHELNDTIVKPCNIEFFDLTNSFANRVYLNGLIFLVNFCFNELYKKKGYLSTKYSADKALYIESSCKLTREMVIELENSMNKVIDAGLRIYKATILRTDAINYFNEIGDTKKAGLLGYITNTYVNLYRLGNTYNYMFSLMPSTTDCLSEFKLTYLSEEGFVLRFPTIFSGTEIPKYKHHPKLFETFKQSKDYLKLVNLETSVDLKLFNKTMEKLLNGEKVKMPVFNFLTGEKEFKKEMQLDKKDILLIEGIHCLNPKILDNLNESNKIKIYLSALTEINIDKDNRIATTDNRLIRRIIRDYYTRGYSPEDTLKLWSSVRDGEEKNIFAFQDEADITINTGLVYEFPILKVYALPLLYKVKKDSPYYEEAKRLIRLLDIFLPVPSEQIPNDSILREFIGGSYFE